MTNKEYAAFVKKLRGKQRQVDFAAKLGIEQARLSAIENGKKGMSMDMAWRLCKHAKVKPTEIMKLYEKNQKKKGRS